jgi:hypothetical protein
MKELLDVYRMNEIDPQTRIRILRKMGNLINAQYGANVTEEIVEELVALLTPRDQF